MLCDECTAHRAACIAFATHWWPTTVRSEANNFLLYSVIVATGIIALVDDCIRRRWHPDDRASWALPAPHSLAKSLEWIGPRRLIDQMLQRRGSA